MSLALRRAFTLLELVLVLVILSIALAAVTPSLGGWSRGMRLRGAAEDIRAATLTAREQAVTRAYPMELAFDLDGVSAWIGLAEGVSAIGFAPDVPRSPAFVLPQGLACSVLDPMGRPLDRIVFQPNGRATAAIIRVFDERGDALEVASTTPAGGFVVQSVGGGR